MKEYCIEDICRDFIIEPEHVYIYAKTKRHFSSCQILEGEMSIDDIILEGLVGQVISKVALK